MPAPPRPRPAWTHPKRRCGWPEAQVSLLAQRHWAGQLEVVGQPAQAAGAARAQASGIIESLAASLDATAERAVFLNGAKLLLERSEPYDPNR